MKGIGLCCLPCSCTGVASASPCFCEGSKRISWGVNLISLDRLKAIKVSD